MKRAALIVTGTIYALLDAALIAAIVVGLGLLGKRIQEQTAVQYAPPAPPAFSGSWFVPPEQEALLVDNMRGGRHCWVYTPLGLNSTHRRARALLSQALCSGL